MRQPEIGEYVRMSAHLKRRLSVGRGLNDNRAHLREFGSCVGVVTGPVEYDKKHSGPEVNVRWLPDGVRMAYHPNDLVKAKLALRDQLREVLARKYCEQTTDYFVKRSGSVTTSITLFRRSFVVLTRERSLREGWCEERFRITKKTVDMMR